MSSSFLRTVAAALFGMPLWALGDVVFSSDFATSQGATFATSGAIGTSGWSVTRSGADWGARIDGGILELTNDASVTANAGGSISVARSLAASGYFDNTLSGSDGLVTWEFNMRQIRPDPSGFGSSNYGVALVIGATSANFQSAGVGYAVVLGQSGAIDPLRLARYENGLQGSLTNILTASSALADVGANYLSLRVTYNPVGNVWSFFGRDDGASSFADPATGTLGSLVASAADSTHTSTALTHMGAYWQGSTVAAQTAFFDNVTISAIPEPSFVGVIGAMAALLFAVRRRTPAL